MLTKAFEGVLFEIVSHLTDFYFVLHQLLLDLCLHVKFGGCVVVTAEDLRLVGLGARVISLMQMTLDDLLKFHVVLRWTVIVQHVVQGPTGLTHQ